LKRHIIIHKIKIEEEGRFHIKEEIDEMENLISNDEYEDNIQREIKEETPFDEDPLNIYTEGEEWTTHIKEEIDENEDPTDNVDCEDTVQREVKKESSLNVEPLNNHNHTTENYDRINEIKEEIDE